MAQTVALARGSVTCYANGSTRATVFTNSASYTATRVIVNSFTVWNSSVPYYTNNMRCGGYLTLIPSGQKGALLAQLPSISASSTVSVIPFSNANNPNGYNPPGSTTGYNPTYAFSPQSGTGAQPAWDNFTNASYVNITNSYGGVFPSNFYMGPSDVLSWFASTSPSNYPKYSGFTTQTIYYNFTLIHES
jgi:hypothetical protein